jgi:acyl-CoA dehydrogenase
MEFELPQEVQLLKDTLRRFVDRELIPIEMHAMDGPDLRPDIRNSLEAKTREMALWLLDTPKEYGGQELSLLALAVIWEEMARTIAIPPRGPSIFGPSVMSILLNLRPEQKEKYLLPVLRGEKTAAFAQTEPDAGSDPAHMRTRAVRQGDHYVVNGYKRFIQHAGDADFIQLVAVTDPEKGAKGGLSVLLVDTDTPGYSIAGKSVHMMGDVTYEIALDDVRVPVSAPTASTRRRAASASPSAASSSPRVTRSRERPSARRCPRARRCSSPSPISIRATRRGASSPTAPRATSTRARRRATKPT